MMSQLSLMGIQASGYLLAQPEKAGPMGAEFGKASPIGLLVLVLLMAMVLYLGYAFHRRFSRYNRRRIFAEQHGLDVFDEEAIDRAMESAGLLDHEKKHWL